MKARKNRRAERTAPRAHFLYWLLPGLLAAVLYLPSLDGGRVWDDSILFERQLPAFTGVGDAFFPPENVPQWPYSYYRPVVTVSHLLDRGFFGPDSDRGPHGMGVAYHVLTSIFAAILAMLALRGFRYRWWGAMAAGALFAAHPIHTESVCWITGRSDTLAGLFLFPSLLAAIRYRDHGSRWMLWTSPVFFLAAALSKELALAALGLLPLCLLFVPSSNPSQKEASKGAPDPERRQRSLRLLLLFAVAAAVYFGLRWAAGAGSGATWLSALSPGEILGTLARASAYYFAKLFVPPPHSLIVTRLPGILLTVCILAITLVAIVLAARRRKEQGVWLLALLWLAVTLLPVLPVAVSSLAEAPVAERYLYVPSWALCLAFGAAVTWGGAQPSRRRWIAGASVLVLLGAGALTVYQAMVWRSDLEIWKDTVQKAPDSGLAWGELGKAYLDRQSDLGKALRAFEKSIETENDAMGRAISYNSLGVIHARQGREGEALAAWRAAVEQNPDYATAHFNLGNLLASRVDHLARNEGRYDFDLLMEGRRHLARAVALDPRYTKAWARLAWADARRALFLALGAKDKREARVALEDAEEARSRLTALHAPEALLGAVDQEIRRASQAIGGLDGSLAGP